MYKMKFRVLHAFPVCFGATHAYGYCMVKYVLLVIKSATHERNLLEIVSFDEICE